MLKETIKSEFTSARKVFMKDKSAENENRKTILGLLIDAIDKKEKAELKVFSDIEIIEVVMKVKKETQDSIAEFKKGTGNENIIRLYEKRLEIIEAYLPKFMSEEEIKDFIKPIILSNGFSSKKDMGKVMGIVVPQLTGKAEKSVISKVVQTLLA